MVLAHNINVGLRTQDVQISEDVTFDTMLLTPNTLEGLTNCGFYKPSPIQLHGIPLGKCGFDLLLEAKSGTGKTAVFTVIALEKLDLAGGLQSVILAPTREIAAQICDVITQIGSKFKNLHVAVVIGGLSVQEDIMKFKKKVHIVVASPGRLRHLIQENHIDISAVRLLVLDEADKLMDKSFKADINYIFSVLPKEKQVIMSSATYPETLKAVMNKYVQNAQHICPDTTTVLLGIKQLVITVKSNSNIVRQTQNRFEELLKILSNKNFKQCLIFCNYQVRVRDLCKMLLRAKWPAEQLHGQQEQTVRLDALRMLQDYRCRILISTDLAARGIDASNIDLVINFEPPYDWQTYLHRIGRAGRFGSYGIAVTILSEGHEESKFKSMIKSMNCSLDLKNFWDEEKFDLDEYESSSDISTFQGIESKDAYDALLKKLTNGVAEKDEETDSFEALCNSFEKTNTSEIESFNDLLTCFKSYKINKYDTTSNECNEISHDDLISTPKQIYNLKSNMKNDIDESLVELRSKTILTPDSYNCTKCGEEQSSMKQDTHSESTAQVNINGAHNKINAKDGLYDLDINKHLLEAGLPTAFASAKSQRKPRNKKLNHSNDKNNKSIKIMQETSNTLNEINMEVRLSRSELLLNTESSSRMLQKSYKMCLDKDNRKESKEKYYNAPDSLCDYEHENNCDNQTKYKLWYNQLKTHIAQIQMCLYIDEISKIKM